MKYAQRKNDTKDRRIVKINLTKQGEKLMHDAMRQRRNKINKLLSYLSQEDKKHLFRILKNVMEKAENDEK